jgi:hypothetical protein
VERAGFDVVTFHTTDNAGTSGIGAVDWIEVTARKPGSGATA